MSAADDGPWYGYRISLRLRHPSMVPQAMTDALGLRPKHAWRAGEPRSTLEGRLLGGVRSESYWAVELGWGDWPPTSLATAIGTALDQLPDRREFPHQVRAEGGPAEFFIG